MIKTDETLKLQMNRLLDESNALLKLEENMLKCCEGIENAVRDFFPKCKAYPFGSRVTGLGNTVRVFFKMKKYFCGL